MLSLAGATVCVTGLGKGERAYVQHVTELVCAHPPRSRVSTHPYTLASAHREQPSRLERRPAGYTAASCTRGARSWW
jgi:hypothetical protein